MAVKNLIPRIQLSQDEQEHLMRRLDEQIAIGEEFHSGNWDEQHAGFWRQYLAEPLTKTKNTPWDNASNLIIPITQTIIEGVLAQEFDAMFANDPVMKVSGLEETDYEVQETLSKYYGEYLYKEVIDMKAIGGDLLLDNCVDGTAVAKVRWNRDTIVRRVPSLEEEPVTEKVRSEFLGQTMEAELTTAIQYRSVETATIETIDEPALDASDMGRIYVAPDSGPSLEWPECRWYYQKQNLTWDDLVERHRKGYDNINEELKGFLGDRELTEKEREQRRKEAVNESTVEPTLEVTEHCMRWPLPARYQRAESEKMKNESSAVDQKEDDEEGYQEEIIVTYCAKAQKLLRVVPLMRLYPDGKRPHMDLRYHRLPRFFYGIGIPSKMKHVQSGTNSMWNQWIDNGTLQNMPFYFYEPATAGDMPNMVGLTPGQGIPVLNASGVQFPRFSNSDNQFWLAALQQLQNWGEKLGNVNDYTQGRAPTTPNAPRTASGQQMMLQAGQVAFARLVALHAERFVEIFRRIHALHRKNAKPETYFRVLNKETGLYKKMSVSNRLFQREVDFQFILNPNRVYEQQQAMQLLQITAPYLMQFNPMGIRPLLEEIWTLNGKKNQFEKIWPAGMMPIIQTGGLGGMPSQLGGGGQPPMQPGQEMPMQGGLPPGALPVQLPPMGNVMPFPAPMMPPIPERPAPEITPEEENVGL